MKRGTIVGIIVGVVLVGGVTAGVVVAAGGGAGDSAVPGASEPAPTPTRAGPEPLPTPTTDGEEGTDDASGTDGAAEAATPGAYVPFTDEALASAEGARVLFFHASWCPSCRALEESILAAGVPDGVTILKVDYDSRQDLRQQHGVRQQTTVVLLDENGGTAELYVPYDEPTIDNALAGLGLSG
jgi:thiol-disulfide isomerase/thioredoxin